MPTPTKRDNDDLAPGLMVLAVKLDHIADDQVAILARLDKLNGSVAANARSVALHDVAIARIEQRCQDRQDLKQKAPEQQSEIEKWKALTPLILAAAALLTMLANMGPEIIKLLGH